MEPTRFVHKLLSDGFKILNPTHPDMNYVRGPFMVHIKSNGTADVYNGTFLETVQMNNDGFRQVQTLATM